jgi:hypothetical protein
MGGASCSMNYVGMQAVWLYQKSGMSSASCAASALTIPVAQNTRICQISYASPRAVAVSCPLLLSTSSALYHGLPPANPPPNHRGCLNRRSPNSGVLDSESVAGRC